MQQPNSAVSTPLSWILKAQAHADLAKKEEDILHKFVLFYVRLVCSINFCFGPVEMRQFKNDCSGLKIDWGSSGCSYLRNAYYVFTFCSLTQVFVDSAYKRLTMALSQARNLLRCNHLSGDLSYFGSLAIFFSVGCTKSKDRHTVGRSCLF